MEAIGGKVGVAGTQFLLRVGVDASMQNLGLGKERWSQDKAPTRQVVSMRSCGGVPGGHHKNAANGPGARRVGFTLSPCAFCHLSSGSMHQHPQQQPLYFTLLYSALRCLVWLLLPSFLASCLAAQGEQVLVECGESPRNPKGNPKGSPKRSH